MPIVMIAPGWHAVPLPKGAGSTKLTKGQKQFNKLVARLKAQRKELAKWQAFKRAYHDRLSGEYHPLSRRLREKRVITAKLLDHALERKALKKRERDKVWETLNGLLLVLLAEEEDVELVQLHDKYADVSFAEQRVSKMEEMREAATRDFGVDVDGYEGEESPEELAEWIAEQVRAAAKTPPEPEEQEKTAKEAARAAREEEIIEGGSRSVREVFRKLVSELHPDREIDPDERDRKTVLMQKVNQAYKTGDLFTLLEMQRSLERLESMVVDGVAEERFRHYNHVLEKQSRRLADEFSALINPFEIAVGDALTRKITPDDVRRALEADIIEIKRVLRTVEMDITHFHELLRLKPSLKNYKPEPFEDAQWTMPDAVRESMSKGRRRRQ
jgi:hypothetical protein